MRFVLHQTLSEFAASSWLQQLSCCATAAPQEDAPPEEDLNDLNDALRHFRDWTSRLQASGAAACAHNSNNNSREQLGAASEQTPPPPPPHQQLLLLAEALQQPEADTSSNATACLKDGRALLEPLKQLGQSTEQLWAAAAASLHTPSPVLPSHAPCQTASHHPTSQAQPAAEAVQQGAQPGSPSTSNPAAVAADSHRAPAYNEEQLKQLLFWLCHMTSAIHKFFMSQAAAAAPASGTKGRKAAAAAAPAAPQQHKWLQQVLPSLLQALLACNRLLVGTCSSGTSSSGTSSSSNSGAAAAASTSCLLSSRRDQAAADRLLLATCLSLLRSSSSSTQTTPKLASKSSSNTATAKPSNSLPASCLQLCASLLGCHLLFRHKQLQQQQQQQQSSQVLVNELCRMLQDQHTPLQKELLCQALSGLLHAASTVQQCSQLLCLVADAAFPCASDAAAAQQQQQQSAGRRKQRGQVVTAHGPASNDTAAAVAAAAAAAADSSDPDSMLLLELLAAALKAQPPSNSAAAGPGCCQVQQLLAAAMLPKLLPAALMASNPAARKLWLGLAGTAAAAGPPAAAGAAGASMIANWQHARAPTAPAAGTVVAALDDTPAEMAAAAVAAAEAHIAGMSALSAAAQSDRDANVRVKALGLLQEAVPCMWQQLAFWQQQQQQQSVAAVSIQEPAVGTVGAYSSNGSSSAHSSRLHCCLAGVTVALQCQLQGSSKACRLKALQLLQLMLEDPAAAAGAPGAAGLDIQEAVIPWQQQLVCDTYPSLCAILDAAQDSPLGNCPASKVAAAGLLPVMASVLQPQQALQLVLSCPAAGSSAAAGQLLQGLSQCSEAALYRVLKQQLMQAGGAGNSAPVEVHSEHSDPSVEHQQLQGQQQQQPLTHRQGQQRLQRLQRLLAGPGSCCSEPLRRHAFLIVCQSLTAAVESTSSATEGSTAAAAALAAAGPAVTDMSDDDDGDVMQAAQHGHTIQERQRQRAAVRQQQELLQRQQELLLAVQLLELSGGCTSAAAQPRDFRGELAILADALDISCYWMKQASSAAPAAAAAAAAGGVGASSPGLTAAAGGGAAEAAMSGEDVCGDGVGDGGVDPQPVKDTIPRAEQQQQQQQEVHKDHNAASVSTDADVSPNFAVCQELLGSLLRILLRAAAAGANGSSTGRGSSSTGKDAAATAAATAGAAEAAAAVAGGQGEMSQRLWSVVGSCLCHHLELVVSLTSFVEPVQLPVETLGMYIQVLCLANRGRQLLLHELLLAWHKDLASNASADSSATAAAAAAAAARDGGGGGAISTGGNSGSSSRCGSSNPTAAAAGGRHAKWVAFLLLLQHLSGFYQLEQARFKQRLINTLRGSAAPDDSHPQTAAAAAGDAAGDADMAEPPPLHAAAAAAAPRAARKRAHSQQPANPANPVNPANPANPAAQNPGPQSPCDDAGGLGFDYMLCEEERQCVEASCADFTAGLLAETAPACYLPLLLQLLQTAEVPTHFKVLALQALQPLLLCSPGLSSLHSLLLAALLADPATPAALQLQAVAAAAALIAARPAQSQLLVQKLEQLLLQGLAAARSAAAGVGGALEDRNLQQQQQEQEQEQAQCKAEQTARAARCDVLASAAGVYCVLLLREQLLLAGTSWGVIAAGLMAPEGLQAVSLTMQQLLACLLTQQRTPRIKAALGLLMNCPDSSSTAAMTPTPPSRSTPAPSAAAAAASGASSGPNNTSTAAAADHPTTAFAATPSSTIQRSITTSTSSSGALSLVQHHLLRFLTPRDLASEELMLPLLQALGQAAAGGGGWGAVAEPAAALLGACCPSSRCLDSLLAIMQAHKHSIAMQCSADTLAHLTSYVSNHKAGSSRAPAAAGDAADADGLVDAMHTSDDSPAAAAAAVPAQKAGRRKGAAAAGQQGSSVAATTQAKLLQLLADAAAAATPAAPTSSRRQSLAPAGGSRRVHAGVKRRSQTAAAAGEDAGGAAAGVRHEELQQLVEERQRELQQYRSAKRA